VEILPAGERAREDCKRKSAPGNLWGQALGGKQREAVWGEEKRPVQEPRANVSPGELFLWRDGVPNLLFPRNFSKSWLGL
jgi:hypothetical protein